MFKLRESKLGFSLIEMMLLLLILSLMTAASVPILSRKHKKAPVKAFHGRYACFWNGNQLWQQQYSGENIIQNEAVSQCKFEAPKKANYFYIQIIGGGGGGGSAGYYRPEDSSSLKVYNYYTNSAKYYVNNYNSSSSLSQFDMTEEEFNDIVGTKYSYLSVGGTRGNYCNEHGTNYTQELTCEGYHEKTGVYHCVDKNDETIYFPEYTTMETCLGLDQWFPWLGGGNNGNGWGWGNIKNGNKAKSNGNSKGKGNGNGNGHGNGNGLGHGPWDGFDWGNIDWGNLPDWFYPDVGRAWVEDMSTGACSNEKYGAAPPTAYSEPQQIKWGVHTYYYTDWSDNGSWYYYSTNRSTGESTGFRNNKGAYIDSYLPRALGGKGYRKYFTMNGSKIAATQVETKGGEGGEQAQCGGSWVGNKSCQCQTSGYLDPRDGEIVYGRDSAPTSSEVCTGADTNCLKKVTSSSPAFYRYEYYQRQNMKYGMGGFAGEYKTFFARQIDPDIIISPGKGGKAGIVTSGTNSYGRRGGDSQLGNMVAAGGEGGMGDRSTGLMRLPTKGDEEFIEGNGIKVQKGDPGAVSPFRYEANLLGIRNPLENTVSYSNFGTGGNGTTVTNNCWEGYYKNIFRGAYNKETGRDEDIEYKDQYVWENVNCKAAGSEYPWTGSTSQTYNGYAGYYRGAVEVKPGDEAQDGYTGAIIISW